MWFPGLRVIGLIRFWLCRSGTTRPHAQRTQRFRGLPPGKRQQAAVGPLASSRAPRVARLFENPPSGCLDAAFHRRTGRTDGAGVRRICDKYSALIGVKLFPHLLRHTMAHGYLDTNPGDLVGLAQILGHENLNTTKRYVQRTAGQLEEAAEMVKY
ncbi:MAG: tyrosine-type recombinase/integrase [Pirellulales bacterium]